MFFFWPALMATAHAGGVDADGDGLGVTDGDRTSSGVLRTAPNLAVGQWSGGLRTGIDVQPLIRQPSAGDPEAVVGLAIPVRLQGAVGLLPALSATLDAPLRVVGTSDLDIASTAFGDLRAGVWLRDPRDRPLSLAAGVEVRLPTGSVKAFASQGRVIPRLALGLGVHDPRFTVEGSLGTAYEGGASTPADTGGLVLDGGLLGRVHLGIAHLGLAARAGRPLAAEVFSRRGQHVELALDNLLTLNDRWSIPLVVSRALSTGAGTPVWRVSAGLVVRGGRAAPSVGSPDPVAVLQALTIVDPDGREVPGAQVTFADGTQRLADTQGVLTFDPADAQPTTVSASGLQSVQAPQSGRVVLPWVPVDLTIRVWSATGESIAPVVRLDGKALSAPGGVSTSLVLPGRYELLVEAPGYGSQRRVFVVGKRRVQPIDIEAVLLASKGGTEVALDVLDPQGVAIENAFVRLDGLHVGTATQGTLSIGGLAASTHEVAVGAQYFRDQSTQVDSASGSGKASIDLLYAPGTVRVTAVGPQGPIVDGTVFVEGPRSFPPLQLGETGEKLIALVEGRWDLLLSSPAHGLQERSIALVPDGPVPLHAAFSLLPEAGGEADLLVRVIDLDGRELENVAITLDGQQVGSTSTGGQLRLQGLAEGEGLIAATGDGLVGTSRAVQLQPGLQAVTLGLGWDPGSLRVAATTLEGPADAQVDFSGPAPYTGGRLGTAGRRLFDGVPPGEWEIVGSHEAGIEVAFAVLERDDAHLTEVQMHLGAAAGDATFELTLRDPDARPIEGAQVWLSGSRLATTASGGRLRVDKLAAGRQEIRVEHPHFASRTEFVALSKGGAPLSWTLPWREALVDLRVTSEGRPVEDATVFAAGPQPQADLELGPDGYERVALTPGRWELLVSSVSGGLAEEVLTLSPGSKAPKAVTIELAPNPKARANVLVRVMDRRGNPISGVSIEADGARLALTDASGTAVVERLPERIITVVHPALLPVRARDLSERREEIFEVEWRPRSLQVEATHGGEPIPVTLTLHGPRRTTQVRIEGSGKVDVVPGRWEIVAQGSKELGVVRQFVEIPTGGELLPVRFVLDTAKVRTTAKGLELIDVNFELGSATPGPDERAVLEEVAATVLANPRIVHLDIEGHTDTIGSADYNFALSRRRASDVAALLTRLGVPPDLLTARGFGPSRPIASNDTEEGRAANRRVEFLTVLSNEPGKP